MKVPKGNCITKRVFTLYTLLQSEKQIYKSKFKILP